MVRLDLPSLAAIVLDVRKTLAPVIHFLPVEAFAFEHPPFLRSSTTRNWLGIDVGEPLRSSRNKARYSSSIGTRKERSKNDEI